MGKNLIQTQIKAIEVFVVVRIVFFYRKLIWSTKYGHK
jgi:hypothetical protein